MIKKLLSRLGKNHDKQATAHNSERHPYAFEDKLVEGYKLCVTMQIQVPLAILKRHGEIVQSIPESDMDFSPEHAVWIPKVKSEFDFLDEGAAMASMIGYVPENGGKLLQYLIKSKEIIERDFKSPESDLVEAQERIVEIRNLPMGSLYEHNQDGALIEEGDPIDYFPRVYGSENRVYEMMFIDFESEIHCKLTSKKVSELISSGYKSIASILQHQDEPEFPH